MDIKGIFKKDRVIGLDIGSTSIKMAQFIRRPDGLHLVKADSREIKGENGVVSVLQDLFGEINAHQSKVVVSINCPKTALKAVKTPCMPKAELRHAISLQARNYFPFPIEDAILDFEITGDIYEKGTKEHEITVAVSPRTTITEYLAILEKAGIKPTALVACPYVLQKLAERLSTGKNQTICIIDMGVLYTELIIFSIKGAKLMLNRKIPVGGMDITEAMTNVLASNLGTTALSLHEAEQIKCEVGIPPDGESILIGNKISTDQILAMLRPPLEQLESEIERCFDYYREETGNDKIDSLVLFGGGTALGGLTKYLSEGLGLEVRRGDAFEGILVETGGIPERGRLAHQLELAIGAALTEGKGINLLPIELQEAKIRLIKRGTLVAILTAIFFASLLLLIGLNIQMNNLEKRIAVAQMELHGLQPQLENTKTHYLASMVLADEPYWEDVFKELGNLVPDKICLTAIYQEGTTITMQGVVAAGANDRKQLVADFIVDLGKGMFKQVRLTKFNDLKGQPGSEFELKCRIN